MLNHKYFRYFAVIFPFVLLLAWTVKVHLAQQDGQDIRLKIVGYDPVDLLSGHYLRFRYDFGKVDLCRNVPNKMSICACLKPSDDDTMEADHVVDCSFAQKQCPLFVKGNCQYNTLLTFSERFYFPEEYATVLANVPPESQATVKISDSGAIALQNIYVKGQDILVYAKEMIRFPNKKD